MASCEDTEVADATAAGGAVLGAQAVTILAQQAGTAWEREKVHCGAQIIHGYPEFDPAWRVLAAASEKVDGKTRSFGQVFNPEDIRKMGMSRSAEPRVVKLIGRLVSVESDPRVEIMLNGAHPEQRVDALHRWIRPAAV